MEWFRNREKSNGNTPWNLVVASIHYNTRSAFTLSDVVLENDEKKLLSDVVIYKYETEDAFLIINSVYKAQIPGSNWTEIPAIYSVLTLYLTLQVESLLILIEVIFFPSITLILFFSASK